MSMNTRENSQTFTWWRTERAAEAGAGVIVGIVGLGCYRTSLHIYHRHTQLEITDRITFIAEFDSLVME